MKSLPESVILNEVKDLTAQDSVQSDRMFEILRRFAPQDDRSRGKA